MKRTVFLAVLPSALLLAGCSSGPMPRISSSRNDGCGGPNPVAKPLASLGQEPKPFELLHEPEEGYKKLVYRFERETSGTAGALRAVVMPYQKSPLVVGDGGVALLRDPKEGWKREATGTEENLYALMYTPEYGKSISPDDAIKRSFHIAVGAHGAALVRGTDGVWRSEKTGTTADLFAVHFGGGGILAAGAGGVMVRRSAEGVWQDVPTYTKANLYGMGPCGDHLCAVGAGGAIVDCATSHGVLACVPRESVTDKDLRLITKWNQILGDETWLSLVSIPEKKDREPRSPVDWEPWPKASASVIKGEARAASENHWIGIGETLVVGAKGAAWLVGNPVIRVKRLSLPYEVDFHGVVYDYVDAFLVGDQGTIIHLGVEGFVPPTICLL